jgi:hypothetical protein
MVSWAVGMVGLLVASAAAAGGGAEGEPAAIERAAAEGPSDPEAERGLFGSGKGPAETIEEKLEEKSDEQKAREERLRQIEDASRDREARVVVLQWRGTDTDYTNESLKRNIKARIARPNALFYPDIDLYQEGRTEPDKTTRPEDQRAIVPDSVLPQIMSEVESIAAIPFDAITEQEWGIRANELLSLTDEIWFIDRQELREPLFMLYAQIGRAAENSNQGAPPFFANVDGQAVNYYWYLAGTLAFADPSLLSKLTTQDLYVPIDNYRNMLDSGVFRQMTFGFGLSDREFDPKAFGSDFEVYVNGVSQLVTDVNGLLQVPLGRTDVYLKRADGHSLSAREERQTLPENYTLLLQIAQTRMGIDFIEQLMANPSECTPLLSGDIVNYLSVYAKLHPRSDVYIAVPRYGSTSPGRIFLWRWDRERAQLFLVQDNTGGFPVRFAALLGAGISFNSATLQYPDDEQLQNAVQEPPPPGQQLDVASTIDGALPIPQFTPEGLPIFYQLRGHYNRVFMGAGLQYKVNLMGEDNKFRDYFQTKTRDGQYAIKFADPDTGTGTGGTTATPTGTADEQVPQVVFRELALQRLVYGTIGVMLGRDAGVGFGPRGYLRYGWYNAPHAVDLTLHLGVSSKAPGSSKDEARSGRVRALLDLDFFGGMLLPFRDSFFLRDEGFMVVGKPIPTFGFTAGAGLTF